MFHTYIASVLSGCCVCVAMVLKCFMCFFASVLDACFKRFICLHTYVASVVSGCLKSRLGVASLSSPSTASPRCLLFLDAVDVWAAWAHVGEGDMGRARVV